MFSRLQWIGKHSGEVYNEPNMWIKNNFILFHFQNCYCALSNILWNSNTNALPSGEADAAGEGQMNGSSW